VTEAQPAEPRGDRARARTALSAEQLYWRSLALLDESGPMILICARWSCSLILLRAGGQFADAEPPRARRRAARRAGGRSRSRWRIRGQRARCRQNAEGRALPPRARDLGAHA
jgi:hypothetical protein